MLSSKNIHFLIRSRTSALLAPLLATIALYGIACDSDISGDVRQNQAPETTLSVRDESLVDNLSGADRLTSTVRVSWSGDDPDGFVQAYEIRFFINGDVSSEDAWSRTASTDSLVLLPIRRGERAADVVFEVRSIDNEELKDPTPARTVFPVENSPPTLQFSRFDLPPDTTFSVVSFAWTADDPEGIENVARIDISLNDSTTFTPIPADATFLTFSADVDISSGSASTVDARVFLGRGFESTSILVPGMALDAENTFYIRAVDATDTTSVLRRFSWYVKRQTSEILYVNDYRKSTDLRVQEFHMGILREYLPLGSPIDVWTISSPFAIGSGGNTPRSDLLPPNAQPTLREMLARFRFIYWVSTNSTNRITGNNLPFTASVMDRFFDNGGKLMVHTPVSLPTDPEENLGNAAILLLPLTDMIAFPDSLRQSLRLVSGASINPVTNLPIGLPGLPALESRGFITNSLPFITGGTNTIPLYNAEYRYVTRLGGRQGPWFGSPVVASLSADLRVGLFALPMLNDQTGVQLLTGADGDTNAPREAIMIMLESLGFPKR